MKISVRTGRRRAELTQTAHDAKTPPQFAQWHTHSCLPREPKGLYAFAAPRAHRPAHPTTSRPSKFLIANARLEFPANPTKQSTEFKSNRERIAIFQWHRHSCLCAFAAPSRHRPAHPTTSQPAKFLIANPRLEFPASPTKQTTDLKSNRERIAIFHLDPHNRIPASIQISQLSPTPTLLPSSPCPRMSVFASLRSARAASRRERAHE
jgi:hypothetical protein